jgi:hypothetical protein
MLFLFWNGPTKYGRGAVDINDMAGFLMNVIISC